MEFIKKIWSVIEKNRWTMIVPIVGFILWFVASVSCTPSTKSPTRIGVQVNAVELQQDYQTWLANNELIAKRFEWAVADIERQEAQWTKLETALMTVATGGVTTWPALLQILVSSGLIGALGDNARKNGVIAGMKINKGV